MREHTDKRRIRTRTAHSQRKAFIQFIADADADDDDVPEGADAAAASGA